MMFCSIFYNRIPTPNQSDTKIVIEFVCMSLGYITQQKGHQTLSYMVHIYIRIRIHIPKIQRRAIGINTKLPKPVYNIQNDCSVLCFIVVSWWWWSRYGYTSNKIYFISCYKCDTSSGTLWKFSWNTLFKTS